VLAELVSVREDLQSVVADIHKLEELDALVSHRPTPPPRAAPAPAQPRAPAEPPPHPKPEKVGHEDELAFIKSVTDDEQSAPSPRRASGAQFQPSVPADVPRQQAPSAPRAANPIPAPIIPDAAAAGDDNDAAAKTLKCHDCGTMNLPTEWYCGQCGGELAAM